ncbi:saccharopine dehydrogenase NADP-binding domain-containing protein [Streptomyces roseirectus]|uniref:Saccharopine dehydrogenase NADP-binding domain-containing protein n=1 Tax=Streptomyces roseirectus TaxID=2768066 RepID=A0A7H0IPT5_9ACTN|nr:saccharopine dehydrogenase NADP-binding domain-containing protein [Streptomyces roseirectus]QNP74801.1 saccharopine dehydrogenase NADP-binding domain-containing protein [Streptomyces roseirectus]
MNRGRTAPVAVGVVGAAGAVGRAVLDELLRLGVGPVRAGVRRPPQRALPAGVELWPDPVEVGDARALGAFCAECRVVVNATGPVRATGHLVASAALAAGADVVDVNDTDELAEPAPYERLLRWRTAVIGAGLMPGLAGLAPGVLVAEAADAGSGVDGSAGAGSGVGGVGAGSGAGVGGSAGAGVRAGGLGGVVEAVASEGRLDGVRGASAGSGGRPRPGQSGPRPDRAAGSTLTVRVGGFPHFPPAAARDFMDRLARPGGEVTAVWRGGRRVAGALAVERDVRLPYFPGAVTAIPYLTEEAVAVAGRYGFGEVRWYTVFGGEHTRAVLDRYRAGLPPGLSVDDAAAELSRASLTDLAGRTPYQAVTCELDGRSLVLTGTDSSALTGTAAAHAAFAVLRGELPPGRLHFAQLPDPGRVLRRIAGAPAVTGLRLLDAPPAELPVEEGIL